VWRVPAGRPIQTDSPAPIYPWTKFGPSLRRSGQRTSFLGHPGPSRQRQRRHNPTTQATPFPKPSPPSPPPPQATVVCGPGRHSWRHIPRHLAIQQHSRSTTATDHEQHPTGQTLGCVGRPCPQPILQFARPYLRYGGRSSLIPMSVGMDIDVVVQCACRWPAVGVGRQPRQSKRMCSNHYPMRTRRRDQSFDCHCRHG
jgi:hypothetical protein